MQRKISPQEAAGFKCEEVSAFEVLTFLGYQDSSSDNRGSAAVRQQQGGAAGASSAAETADLRTEAREPFPAVAALAEKSDRATTEALKTDENPKTGPAEKSPAKAAARPSAKA